MLQRSAPGLRVPSREPTGGDRIAVQDLLCHGFTFADQDEERYGLPPTAHSTYLVAWTEARLGASPLPENCVRATGGMYEFSTICSGQNDVARLRLRERSACFHTPWTSSNGKPPGTTAVNGLVRVLIRSACFLPRSMAGARSDRRGRGQRHEQHEIHDNFFLFGITAEQVPSSRPHHRRVCEGYLARHAVPRLLVENACGQPWLRH